jgi:DNA invertase Pin-like site-specific DNA recombinase
MEMLTSEKIHELIALKRSDREKFLELLEDLARGKADVLLTYRRFKEYPSNV